MHLTFLMFAPHIHYERLFNDKPLALRNRSDFKDTFSTISINRIVDTIRIKQWWTLGGCLGRTTAPEKRSLGHLQCAKHKIGVSAAPLCSTAYQIFLGSMQYLNNFPFMVIVSEITPPTVAVFVLREL